MELVRIRMTTWTKLEACWQHLAATLTKSARVFAPESVFLPAAILR